MKKQFFRVKQLADQAIARAEKSEVLTEDLAASERRVENLRVSCSVIRKRLTESLSGHGADDDAKRLRKMQEHQLGAAMKEGAAHVGTDTILGAIMSECGEAQTRLAGERLEYERALEQTVLESSVLQQLLDTDIPSVTKLRKTLARLTLDMDASRSRYQNAQRHSAGAVGGAGPQQKVEAIRDELEAAQIKVEQHRDTLAGDMFQLLSREPELAQLLLHLVKLQTEYYRSSMQLLESTIPGLQASLNAASVKPVFGLSLEEHLRVSGRQVALPLEMCVCRLLQIGADEEGLFRVAGSTSKARKLKSCFDAGLVTTEHMTEYVDAHVVADALKAYLRDLPEPLMTTDFYDEWMAAARVQDEGQRLQALWQVLHQLPDAHYANLRYLIKFLALLSKNNKVNKMTTQNIAIVMAPNLLWTRIEEGFNMTATGTHSLVVDSLIQHCDWFFPEEVDFFITYPRELPSEAPPATTAAAPDSPVLSNGSAPLSRPTPGHQRSKSTDSGVVSAAASVAMAAVGVESAAGESASGSSASLTSSDPSMHHCESPKPTMRRKKQAAPPPPTHRQTIAASAPAHGSARPTAEAPPPPAAEADAEGKPDHHVRPEVPVSKPEIPVWKSEIPVSKPEVPASRPEVPAPRPESDSAPSSTVTAAAAAAAASAAGRAGADAESGRALADLVQKSAAIAAGAASAAAAVSRAEATRAAPAPSTPAPVPAAITTTPAPSAASITHTTHVGHADPAAAGGAPPVPAPRGGPTAATPPSSAAGVSATPGKTPRPDRPPPPAKLVERAASFSPSDTSGAQRQKPALPERPGTLRRTPRNSAEMTSSRDSAGSTDAQTPPVLDSQSGVVPPPIGWAVPAVPAPTAGSTEPRARPRPSGHPPSAPPPVPAPRATAAAGDTTTHL